MNFSFPPSSGILLRYRLRRAYWNFRRSAQQCQALFLNSHKVIGPDFFVIGVPRAATTWLHKILSHHPDVFLPKEKELHFFNTKRVPKGHNYGLIWSREYYFDLKSKHAWRWYALRFRNAGERIKGDITPEYCILPHHRIMRIKHYAPSAKIILLIRNPVDRAWSSVRKMLWKQRGLRAANFRDILGVATHPEILIRGAYRDIITNWSSIFSEQQMMYVFFDDIIERPLETLEGIFAFLGISSVPLDVNLLAPVNAVPKNKMPAHVKQALINSYEDDITFIRNKFGRSLSNWH